MVASGLSFYIALSFSTPIENQVIHIILEQAKNVIFRVYIMLLQEYNEPGSPSGYPIKPGHMPGFMISSDILGLW